MSRVFHRLTGDNPPIASGGDGCYIHDQTGKAYLDASGGAAVSCLGHSDKAVIGAVKAQLESIAYAHTAFFTNPAMESLADRLTAAAPEGLEKVWFTSGGSESVESALKLARQYFFERGEPQRRHLIARRQSYHGNTLGALSTGGNEFRRALFEPLLLDVHHIAPCRVWRDCRAEETEADYGHRVADELDQTICRLKAENVIGFVAETVVGSTMGAVPPAEGYFRRIRDICDRHGILLILDEVMCGMGRTGHMFACEEDGISPDMIAIAKGLGAGYQPVGAVLVSGDIHDAIREGSGSFRHGHTYMGHPVACAAALAVQEQIEERQLLSAVRKQGAALRTALEEAFGNHPHVGDIRGRGLFIGLELVAERGSKEPFSPEHALHARIKAAALEAGLICYPGGGGVDGLRGDHVLLAPPFIISDAQIGELTEKLRDSVDNALSQIV